MLNSLDLISGCADCYTEHKTEHGPAHVEQPKPAPSSNPHPAGATHGGRPPE